jgi:UDP-N-acetyl-D-glucosamine dehydrogenase
VNDTHHSLLARIQNRQATVGVIGLGYVGLPLALTFSERGFSVLGFDIDAHKVEMLAAGDCYIRHLDCDRVRAAVSSGKLSATTDFSRLGEPDAILVCVPTPLTRQREPDMTYVRRAAFQVRERLRSGQLVVLESTTYPGTTDELLLPVLEGRADKREPGQAVGFGNRAPEARVFQCGADFFLAFSPEREDPGNPSWGTTNTPKVVGGVDEISGDLAQALYDQVVDRTVRVSSARVAEAAKLMENIFRAVNIALVNELKIVFDRMGIDIWEVLDAAETKPFGFMRFDPGPGWGGHCIPIDPFYLAWKAREHGMTSKFIELAGEINTRMPGYVIEKLTLALNERGKAVKGSKILVLGLAYKPDIDDPRESPAFEIIDRLLGLGAEVSYHDPHIPVAPRMRSWPDLPVMQSEDLTRELLESSDGVVVVTDHTMTDYELIARHANLLIDTRGVARAFLCRSVSA